MRSTANASTRASAVVATTLGLGHAAVSGYWLLGGTALLDTIGGPIEEWGRQRAASTLIALAGITALNAVVPSAAVLYAGIGTAVLPNAFFDLAQDRRARLLGWVAAGVLVLYGGVLTVVGLMVEAGVLDPAPDADERALAWHAFLWDPWFLAWGVAPAVTLRSSTPQR